MERVETLLKKLQDQFTQRASADQLLLTVQMLQSELQLLKGCSSNSFGNVLVTVDQQASGIPMDIKEIVSAKMISVPEERTVEVLQIDEAEVEAELEEIKRNAEAMQKISAQNKPHITFEPQEDIPTLVHQQQKEEHKKEVGQVTVNDNSSINDTLKQSSIDLGDTLLRTPVKDLKKAIGINDRFLYINELFRGDEVAYERSIKTINGFSILPEAEYWIQRELKVKNGWDDSNEVAQQFYHLIKRRFS